MRFKQQANNSNTFCLGANQVHSNIPLTQDEGHGWQGGQSGHGRGCNGGRYIPRCQLCSQLGHRVHDYREQFKWNFQEWQYHNQSQNSKK